MRVIRWTHSCVRLEQDGRVLVIDPGIWSEPSALRGADAVVLTHDHADHADVLRLRGLAVPVFAPHGTDLPGVDVVPVRAGETFDAAGFALRAFGGTHATVLPELEPSANLGYLVDGALYHPGDALARPHMPVETLAVPMQASWLKTAEAVAFVRAVAAQRAFGIHDAQVNERALGSLNHWIGEYGRTDYRWLAPGSAL